MAANAAVEAKRSEFARTSSGRPRTSLSDLPLAKNLEDKCDNPYLHGTAFSEVPCTLTSHSRFTRALTFENLCQFSTRALTLENFCLRICVKNLCHEGTDF